MVSNIKSVLIALTKESGEDEVPSALSYGLSLAHQANAHATVEAASLKLALTGPVVGDFVAGLVDAENRRLQALTNLAVQRAQADAAASGVVCSTQNPQLSYTDLLASFTAQARVHDLTVIDGEPEAMVPDRALIEALLLNSGRPLIIVPPGREVFSSRRMVVAWDGSARAARAVADALPLLRAAEAVEVVSVTGEKPLPDNLEGADIARHLTRHGVPVTLQSVSARDGDVAQTLRDAATLFGANMLVMGGYVHSRLREMFFGGVTQSLLKASPVPLFMSH
jgi:nucleotide-binding universal stress UspA family protein